MNDWSFERAGDDEIAISVTGRWTDYHVSFTWMDDIEALHLACAFDLKVPEPRRTEVLALIALINEQLWVGHFDLWTKDGIVMFRHALVLAGGVEIVGPAVRGAARAALDTCERYFQAFQFVVWAGKRRARRSTPRCSRPPARREVTSAAIAAWPALPRCCRRSAETSPARSCWSAPARWAARCWKAGSRSGSIRRNVVDRSSRSPRREIAALAARGVRINPAAGRATPSVIVHRGQAAGRRRGRAGA